ncbi:MAG: cell division protein ZapA [Candidatus Eisenbacteria bacterium]|nr:cell division protein ZapA [Candidatus Eisenbacteria bacterium]
MGEAQYNRVTILGEEYRIGGDASGAPVPELAAYVNEKIQEVRRHGATADPKRVAVLASLNLADELFRERALAAALLTEVKRRVAKMDSILTESLRERG